MLVGRKGDLEQVNAAITQQRVAVVRGAFGIGKTALVRAVADEHPGALWGQALPAMGGRAYHPWLHALGWTPRPVEPAAMAALVASALDGAPLLVLEDLQWADPGTLAVLVEVHRRCPLVVTVQDGAIGSERALKVLASLDAAEVRLGPLGAEALDRLILDLQPGLLRGERIDLAERSGGNPLLVNVLTHSDVDAVDPVQGDGRAIVRAFVERTSDATRELLALLALTPTSIDPELLRPDLRDAVPALAGSGLVTETAQGNLVATHSTLADAALHGLDEAGRRRVFDVLSRCGDVPAWRRAEFLLAIGDDTEACRMAWNAAHAPTTHADQARALHVAAQASMAILDRGGDLPDGVLDDPCDDPSPDGSTAGDSTAGDSTPGDSTPDHGADTPSPEVGQLERLVLRAAHALNESTEFDAAADLLGDPSRFAASRRALAVLELLRAAAGRGDRAFGAWVVSQVDDWLRGLRGPEERRARAAAASLEGWSGSLDAARLDEMAGRQLALAEDGTERSEAALLVALAASTRSAAEVAQALHAAKLDAETARAFGSEMTAARNLVLVQVSVGRHAEGRALALEYAAKADEAGEVGWAIDFRTLESVSRFYDGADHDEVISWLSWVRSAPVRLETRAIATASLATLLADRGDASRSESVLAPWIEPDVLEGLEPMSQGVISWGAVQRAWILGDLATAIRHARRATERLPPGFPSLAGIQVTWRWAEFESGAAVTAPRPEGGFLDCARLESDGIDLLVSGDHAAAVEVFLSAAEVWRPVLWRCALRSRWGAGLAALKGGDRELAVELLHGVDDELDVAGSPALRPRVAATLRAAHGEHHHTAAPDAAKRPGPVTSRERQVLELVGKGWTSSEIGHRLGISSATVDSHVRAASQKLGVRTRIEAAALLATLGTPA